VHVLFLHRKEMPDISELKKWFMKSKRSFPWREDSSPYAVWVSEVMLQQTRASVVIPYFLKWMKLFPTMEALALAPIEKVLKAWEGLGYYSRARSLQEGAKSLIGIPFPSSKEELLKIKGIGPYTAGAILSFSFKQKSPAVDGNVLRVISRYFGLKEDLHNVKGKALLEEKTLIFLEDEEPWILMEALIELGATVCQKKANCLECPLKDKCEAFAKGSVEAIPYKKKRAETVYLQTQVVVIICEDEVLLEVGKEGTLLGGLAQFPSFPYSFNSEVLGLHVEWIEDLPSEKQTYTKYQEDLFPSLFSLREKKEVEGYIWYKIEALSEVTFSSGHRRILQKMPLLAEKG
jgi:A/G-specific adenine glycosylase